MVRTKNTFQLLIIGRIYGAPNKGTNRFGILDAIRWENISTGTRNTGKAESSLENDYGDEQYQNVDHEKVIGDKDGREDI